MPKLLLVSSNTVFPNLIRRYLPNAKLLVEQHAMPAINRILTEDVDLVLLGEKVEHGSPTAVLSALPKDAEHFFPILFVQFKGDPVQAIEVLNQGAIEAVDLGSEISTQFTQAVERILRLHNLHRENHRIRKEMERSNAELSQFASAIAHDLREPLRKIASFGQMLEEELQEFPVTPDAKQYLGKIQNSAVRMNEMLHSLLDLAKVSASGIPEEWHSLSKALNVALEHLEHRIAESSAKIEYPSALPLALNSHAHLVQLFQNLIGNAIKYRHATRPPILRITATRVGDGLMLEFRDNGIGFDPRYAQEVFGIFRRLHGRNSTLEGHGVGLAICLRIVQRMNGTIEAHGVPEEGALFRIHLPLVNWHSDNRVESHT